MFISFAPPKEMNQRKRGRITHAPLLRIFNIIKFVPWFSSGLREFWDKANVLRLAA